LTQTIDARAECGQYARKQEATSGKTDAETARNGDSFLAIIEKMLAGTMDGLNLHNAQQAKGKTAKGAGQGQTVPGDLDTLNNRTEKVATVTEKNQGEEHPTEDIIGLSACALFPSGHAALELAQSVVDGKKTDGTQLADSAEGIQNPSRKLLGSGQDVAVLYPLAENSGLTGVKLAAHQIKGSGGQGALKGPDDSDESLLKSFASEQNAHLDHTVSSVSATEHENGSLRNLRTNEGDGRSPPYLTVQDHRAVHPEGVQSGTCDAVSTVRLTGDGSADMSLFFRLPDGRGETSHMFSSDAAFSSKSFADMLSAELRSSLPDIVRTGAIVLKDAHSGLIRLTLHPEHLGNVRISLDLNDRKVGGRIIVSSREAYDAFVGNMDALRDAFISEGFTSDGFDLSWHDGKDESGSQTADGQTSAPFYAGSIPDVMSGRKSADRIEGGYSHGPTGVNLLA